MRFRIAMPTLGNSPWWRESVASTDPLPNAERVLVSPGAVPAGAETWLRVEDRRAGLYAAVNRGLRAAGDWEAGTYLNDDDRLVASGIAVALERLRGDGRLGAVFGRVHLIDAEGRRYGEIPVSRRDDDFGPLMSVGIVPMAQPGTLFRKQMFEELGGFDETWKAAGDMDFFMRARRAGWRFAFVDADVAEFRVSAGQISQQRVAREEFDRLVSNARRHPDWVNAATAARRRFRRHNLGVYLRRLFRHGFVSMRTMYKPAGGGR